MIRNQTIIDFGDGLIGCAQGPSAPGMYIIKFRLLNAAEPVGDIPYERWGVFDEALGNSEVVMSFENIESLKQVALGLSRAVGHYEKQLAREAE